MDMDITLGGLGSIASGAGNLLSGIFGSKKKEGPSLAEQSAAGLLHERQSFDQKMALAKEHGLHPLSVLGVPVSTFSPAISSPVASGPDFSAIGSGVEQIAKSFVKPPEAAPAVVDANQERLNNANVRIAEARANKEEWEALRSQWVTQDLLRGQPGNPPAVRSSNDGTVTTRLAAEQAGVSPSLFDKHVEVKQSVLPPHDSFLGTAMGVDQSWKRGIDQRGRFFSILNNDLFNADFEEGATINALAKYFGPERAIEIAAVLEQAGVIGGVGAGGYAGYKLYREGQDRKRLKAYNSGRMSGGGGSAGGSAFFNNMRQRDALR